MENQTTTGTVRRFGQQEQDQHARAIEKLVQELGVSAEEVRQSYQEILETFKKDAKVSTFLPVLVSRSVKERLKNR
jgi:hypothetical protein